MIVTSYKLMELTPADVWNFAGLLGFAVRILQRVHMSQWFWISLCVYLANTKVSFFANIIFERWNFPKVLGKKIQKYKKYNEHVRRAPIKEKNCVLIL